MAKLSFIENYNNSIQKLAVIIVEKDNLCGENYAFATGE